MKFICILLLTSIVAQNTFSQTARDFYEIKIYRVKDNVQIASIDAFLKDAYLPALHRLGIKKIGVFKPAVDGTEEFTKAIGVYKPSALDTDRLKSIYVFIPFQSLKQFYEVTRYFDAAYGDVPYQRVETILLEAFPGQPTFKMPALTASLQDRIYELRSYEAPTDGKYASKVKMFHAGGELALLKKLGFNPVFCAGVLAGSHMPNLMYMTSFENMDARNVHWRAFLSSPEFPKLASTPEYSNTISGAEVLLCHAAEYSDIK